MYVARKLYHHKLVAHWKIFRRSKFLFFSHSYRKRQSDGPQATAAEVETASRQLESEVGRPSVRHIARRNYEERGI